VKIVNNSFTGALAQLVSNDRAQCQYTTAVTGIGIVFLVIGAIPGIGGAKSKEIVTKLSGLFAIDSFAGGFVIQSIVSFWFFTKFGVELTTLSYIFSIAGVLTAFSFLVAAKLADKIGLINTMVFTHIILNSS
jgi:hypothetical protein